MRTLNEYLVGRILRAVREPVLIDEDGFYSSLGIRSFGRGIFHYNEVAGADLTKLRHYSFPANALAISNIKGWEGAIAVTTKEDTRSVASSRFLFYAPSVDMVDTRYLYYYFLSEPGLAQIGRASPGSADRNRTLSIKGFEALTVNLPDIAEQRRVATHLDLLLNVNSTLEGHVASDEITAISTRGISQIMRRFAAGTVKVRELCRLVSDTVHPGDDPAPAKEFIGLEHVRPHLGVTLGSREIGGEKGRKFRFSSGDILYGYLRPYLNKVWLADRPGLCSVEQYVLRPNGSIPAELLAHGLRSAETLNKVVALTHNLQLPRLRSGLLLDLELPWIPEEAHADAIQALRQLDMKILRLTELKSAQKSGLAALRPALLNAAFSGGL